MKNKILLACILLLCTNLSPAQVIVTAAGTGVAGFSGDNGPAINAELYHPYGVTLDDSGNLYICDGVNRRVRKVSPGYGGIITTIAGNGTIGYSGDGGLGVDAQIDGAIDVAVDRYGNVYIADGGSTSNCIRKITPGDTITTIAGTGIAGYNGDGIPASTAQLNIPAGIAVDSIGNIYIADEFNHRIRMVDTTGIIHTIAGTGIAGFSPDGSRADTAELDMPFNIRIDKTGNLFFADSARIRKIDTNGIIKTVAGNGIYGYSGDTVFAITAEIGGGAIALDTAGNLFIADEGSNRVREVNVEGVIYTIVDSNGTAGFNGDNGNPLVAEICEPQGVTVSNSGDIYIGDVGNNRVRLVTRHPLQVNSLSNQEQKINVFPNPSAGLFTFIISSNVNEQAQVSITNMVGEQVKHFSIMTNQQIQVQMYAAPGIYYLSATTTQNELNQKLIIE